jgi:hypothetical protein
MANNGHRVTSPSIASLNRYIRKHTRRSGRFMLDMTGLPDPLDPQPPPFEITAWPL